MAVDGSFVASRLTRCGTRFVQHSAKSCNCKYSSRVLSWKFYASYRFAHLKVSSSSFAYDCSSSYRSTFL
jgi:hypothetical protein